MNKLLLTLVLISGNAFAVNTDNPNIVGNDFCAVDPYGNIPKGCGIIRYDSNSVEYNQELDAINKRIEELKAKLNELSRKGE